MKRLSICLPALALAMMLILSSSTPAHAPSTPKSPKTYIYYWYSYPDDTFNDYKILSDEEWEWILILNVNIDTNPMGGTLIERGYLRSNYPHVTFADVYLYAHY